MNSLDWKDVAHYGSALVCLAMAGLSELGVSLPGVTVDPKVAGAAGIGILAAGLKSGVTSGKAAICFLALALAAASAGDAQAADLSRKPVVNPYVKALPALDCTVTACTGFFIGGNLANVGTSLDVIGQGIQGIAQNGLGIGGQFGYEYFANNIYAAAFCTADYDASLSTMASVNDRSTWGCGVRAGYSLANAFSTVTNGGPNPTLPQQFLQSLMTPYFDIEEVKRHGQPAFVSGAGVEALVAADPAGHSSWTLNADILRYTYNQGGTSGTFAGTPIQQSGETVVRVGLNKHVGWGN